MYNYVMSLPNAMHAYDKFSMTPHPKNNFSTIQCARVQLRRLVSILNFTNHLM
jgi:hypothetical protein